MFCWIRSLAGVTLKMLAFYLRAFEAVSLILLRGLIGFVDLVLILI